MLMVICIDEFVMVVGLHIDFLGWLNDRHSKLFIFFEILEYSIVLEVSYLILSDS